MTIPSERTRAVLFAQEFLEDLCNPKKTPKVPKYIRQQAGIILRYYPNKFDLDITNELWDNKFMECPFGKYEI